MQRTKDASCVAATEIMVHFLSIPARITTPVVLLTFLRRLRHTRATGTYVTELTRPAGRCMVTTG